VRLAARDADQLVAQELVVADAPQVHILVPRVGVDLQEAAVPPPAATAREAGGVVDPQLGLAVVGRRLGRGCQRGVELRPPLAVVTGTAGFAELADDVAATLLRDPLMDLRF
jgi:hypothetical protein